MNTPSSKTERNSCWIPYADVKLAVFHKTLRFEFVRFWVRFWVMKECPIATLALRIVTVIRGTRKKRNTPSIRDED